MPRASSASVRSYLQYEMSTLTSLGSTVGVWTTIVLDTDLDSFGNGYLTKPTTSRFQATFNCSVRVTYRCRIDPAGNNNGTAARVLLNGTTDVGNRSYSQDGADRAADAENNFLAATFIMNLNAGEYIELQGSPTEAAATSFVPQTTIMLVELVRLR